jgi:predicted DNA-binding transcriptional regulator AlpA
MGIVRAKRAAQMRGQSVSGFYADLASGRLDLTRIKIGPRAVGYDEGEILSDKLNRLADAKGLTGAQRERWVSEEFIKEKAIAEQVGEYRRRTEAKPPRGIHAKNRQAFVAAE